MSGYVPNTSSLEAATKRYMKRYSGDRLRSADTDDVTAWLLSSLARRHARYRSRVAADRLELETWVLKQSPVDNGELKEWFSCDPDPDYRIYLHAYKRNYDDRELWWNIFSYPHRQLSVKHRRWPYVHLKCIDEFANAWLKVHPQEATPAKP